MKWTGFSARVIIILFAFRGPAAAQEIQSGFIPVGPDTIYYETAGHGPTVVLIHDGLVHSRVWDGQFREFTKSRRVIRYDRRGYGKSPAPTVAFSQTDDLIKVFAHLNIERACLMGMSSGGRLAIDFALQYPEKVTSLVLVGAVVGGFPYTDHCLSRGGHRPELPNDVLSHVQYYVNDDPYEIYAENKAAREKVKELVRIFPRRPGTVGDHDETPAKPAYLRLAEIHIPALILVGEFDIPDVHAHAGAINAGIANSRRAIIPKSGHLIPIEQPELFNDAVRIFLKDIK